jgi:PIN domain nuclease of toxin-antitoxin system
VKLLLDTHVWLWSVLEPERLAPRVARAIEAQDNELWLSPISAWELLVLVEKGRLVLDRPPARWIADVCATIPLRDAPLTRHVAIESRRLALSHEDPADRFIAATAKVYDLTLVTSDERLLRLDGIKTFGRR